MAVPILGKFIVLTVLILIYASYAFRIRDVGQIVNSDQQLCHNDPDKCSDVDSKTSGGGGAGVGGRKNRVDPGGVGVVGRLRANFFGKKLDVNEIDDGNDEAKVINHFGHGKVKLRININKKIDKNDGDVSDDDNRGDEDDDDNDDDDDDDVVIEDGEELNEIDSDDENTEEEEGNENDDDDDDDDDEEENDDDKEEEVERELKWNLKSEFRKINKRELNSEELTDDDNYDDDDESKKTSTSKRIEVRKEMKNLEHEKRTKNEKIKVVSEVKKSVDEEMNNLSVELDDDDDDDESEIDDVKLKKVEKLNKIEEQKVSEKKNPPPLRKFEKVHLADKDKVKEEIKPVKIIEDKSEIINKQEETTSENEVKLKNDSPILPKEEIKNKEKKKSKNSVAGEVKKKKTEVQIDTTTKNNEENNGKKNKNGGDADGEAKKNKNKKSGKIKEKNKINSNSKKEKSITPRKQSETSISLSKLNDEILRLPNFIPNFTAVENPVCQQHGKIFLRQLRGYKLWALQMLDSSAKIPSGLLRGNVNQLGDFDECLGILAHVKLNEKTIKVQGKYCLANVDIYPGSGAMKVPINLIQSRNFLRGTLHDTGHFVPKFTTINWALCLPSACSSADAQNAMSSALNYLNGTSGFKFNVDVDPDKCYVHQRTQNYSKETIGVLYFFVMILCLVLVVTLRDFLIVTDGKANYSERIIMSFSLRRTIKILMKQNRDDSSDINCIHGIRSLATIALYVGHKMIPIARLPFSNRIVLTEISNNPLSSLLRVSIIYTDSFLILSGVLSAFNMSQESEIRGEIRWFCRFVSRFIRLTPALLVVIFWYSYVMEHIGSGPQWNIMSENADLCKKNSWTNLLYIQNFFPFEEMCATHTHQLALDMQLSLLAPILVFFLQVKPTIGILLIFFLLQVSATLRYFATTNNYLSVVIYHGMTVKQLYKTANLTYAISMHRLTPYLFGVGLGVLIHRTGKNVKIYRIFVIFGWIIAFMLGAWSIFSPWPMTKRDYIYNLENSAHYAVIGPVTWALTLCWIIFACFTDNAGIINRFLSNYWLIVFSRISYSVYLTQFAVFFYNVATTRYSTEFQVHRAIDLYEVLTVIIISTILTLFFDIPMQEVKSVLMECTDIASTKSDSTKPNPEELNDNPETPSANQDNSELQKENGKQSTTNPGNYYDNETTERQSWRWTRDEYNMTTNNERRRSKSVQRINADVDNEFSHRDTPNRYQDDNRRGRRSLSRSIDTNFKQQQQLQSDRDLKRDRLNILSRKSQATLTSSGSDDNDEDDDDNLLMKRRGKSPRRQQIERPRVSDEEDWEQELRIRRRRFMERMAESEIKNNSQKLEKENIENSYEGTPRSSAEGKIALLSGTSGGMDAWTVSQGTRIDGSSPELSDNDDNYRFDQQRKVEREFPSENIKLNSTEEEEYDDDDDKYNNELQSPSNKKLMMMEMRQSQDDKAEKIGNSSSSSANDNNNVTPVSSGKLFKRASIVKSQASEEDPEYLLPERPKLVEQEQEHPFKKAWQMQKSRSEEDGPSAFVIRDVKVQQGELNQTEKSSSSMSTSPPLVSNRVAPQTFQLVIEDVDVDRRVQENARSRDEEKQEEAEEQNQEFPEDGSGPSGVGIDDEDFDQHEGQLETSGRKLEE